jgi:hypothetical protein
VELIRASGMRRFPPRLPEQSIFYPVLNCDYARQIAERWNTKDSAGHPTQVGFVTEFDLPAEYFERFEQHAVGASLHRELWVPAQELGSFNSQLVGRIRVTDVYYGADYQGPRLDLEAFNAESGGLP